MERSTERILARGDFNEFGATIGFDALRVAMGHHPRNHDVETICRWLRHVAAMRGVNRPHQPSFPERDPAS